MSEPDSAEPAARPEEDPAEAPTTAPEPVPVAEEPTTEEPATAAAPQPEKAEDAPQAEASKPDTTTEAEPSGSEPAKEGGHEVGSRVYCQASFDKQYHSAEVIEKRKDSEDWTYYVHYSDFNKRLDEWVPAKSVELTKPGGAQGIECASPAIPGGAPGVAGDLLTPMGTDRKVTRNLKRRHDEIYHIPKPVEDLPPVDQSLEKEHEEKTKVKNVQMIRMGFWEIDTWYYSPYPDEYAQESELFVCEFCLKYMKKKKTLIRHRAKCTTRHPPGDEIYRHKGSLTRVGAPGPLLSMFEVDGKKNKLYCQNLCLLAKLFLDHKTLYYDVDPFLFYILTEYDDRGYHIVGYFSKEKSSLEDYNLACILTLPPYQRKGYGRFLIAFAYELSKKEGKVGTPERPLSDLGQVSFRSYWTRVLLDILKEHRGNLSIKDLSQMTAIRSDDIVSTLQSLNLIKYWKGQYIISVTPKVIEEHLKNMASKYHPHIDTSTLHWTPIVQKKP